MALSLSPTRKVIRGDSDRIQVKFTKKNGKSKIPVDITDWTIKFTVRKEVPASSVMDDNDAILTADGTIVNAEEGIVHIYIESEQTRQVEPGKYLYDIQVVWPIDDFGCQKVKSIVRGKYVVIGDITRR